MVPTHPFRTCRTCRGGSTMPIGEPQPSPEIGSDPPPMGLSAEPRHGASPADALWEVEAARKIFRGRARNRSEQHFSSIQARWATPNRSLTNVRHQRPATNRPHGCNEIRQPYPGTFRGPYSTQTVTQLSFQQAKWTREWNILHSTAISHSVPSHLSSTDERGRCSCLTKSKTTIDRNHVEVSWPNGTSMSNTLLACLQFKQIYLIPYT